MKILKNQIAEVKKTEAEIEALQREQELMERDQADLAERNDTSDKGTRQLGLVMMRLHAIPALLRKAQEDAGVLRETMLAEAVKQRRDLRVRTFARIEKIEAQIAAKLAPLVKCDDRKLKELVGDVAAFNPEIAVVQKSMDLLSGPVFELRKPETALAYAEAVFAAAVKMGFETE